MSDEDLLEHAEDFLMWGCLSFLLSGLLGDLLVVLACAFGFLWASTHLIVLWRNRNPS